MLHEFSYLERQIIFFLCRGYSAPEGMFEGVVSRKADIYSVGVIIIELVTGSNKKPSITNLSVLCLVPFFLNHGNIFFSTH